MGKHFSSPILMVNYNIICYFICFLFLSFYFERSFYKGSHCVHCYHNSLPSCDARKDRISKTLIQILVAFYLRLSNLTNDNVQLGIHNDRPLVMPFCIVSRVRALRQRANSVNLCKILLVLTILESSSAFIANFASPDDLDDRYRCADLVGSRKKTGCHLRQELVILVLQNILSIIIITIIISAAPSST